MPSTPIVKWEDIKGIKRWENPKKPAWEEMDEDASPSQTSQQDREFEVNDTGSAGSPVPPDHFAFGLRITVDGVATTHTSHSVSPDSVSPYNSQTWHCLLVQVTLRDSQGLSPLPKYAWMG